MWARAPSTLSERRSARASCQAAATLTTAPSRPTTSTIPPSTSVGANRRWTASMAITPASTSSETPLICAERISARPSPNVKRRLGGRAASRAATSASASEAASVSMCAASESSASEPARMPATTSATMNARIRASAAPSRRWSASADTAW